MDQKVITSNQFVRFALNSSGNYIPLVCAEASPGQTFLTLSVCFDTKAPEHTTILETLIVPSHIHVAAIDLLQNFWESRIAEEHGYDIMEFEDSMAGWYELGSVPQDADVTTRHDDLINQAICDIANGATAKTHTICLDEAGSLLSLGDTICCKDHPDISFEIVPYDGIDLAILIPLAEGQQIVPLARLEGYVFDKVGHLSGWFRDTD